MPNSRQRIVLVEDNAGDAFLACERRAEAPDSTVSVDVATSLAQAMALIAEGAADAIVLDLNLPDSQGLETLRRLKTVAGTTPIIVVSGQFDPVLRSQALAAGAEDAFGKDETNSRLFIRSVLYVIERNRARLQQQRLQDLLDATPDAILVAAPSGAVRFVNAAAVELFNRTRAELLAEPLGFSAAVGETVEISIPRADSLRTCEMRIANLQWDGEAVHLASIRDITERQQAEQLRIHSAELEAQNRHFQEANRLKTEFLANMSHEIRTPMNAIIGLSHLLDKTRLSGDQRSFLGKIQIASRSLLGVINDVLDLSKIEAGELSLEDEPFDLFRLLRELEHMLHDQADSKHVELVVNKPVNVPRLVRGDVTRVRQILVNLLGNAIKFTEHGRVTLDVQTQSRDDGRLDLGFAVRDTGIGIAAADLARLFKPFTQADASTTRRFGGTGLGLSIVNQLAQLMGGQVAAKSELGVGSEFSVMLPLTVVDERRSAERGTSHTFDIWVTESDKGRLRQILSIARALGWRVEGAANVEKSLGLALKQLRDGKPPDLWIIDVDADDTPARHRLAELREQVGVERWPPCVMVTPAKAGAGGATPGLAVEVALPLTATALFQAARAALREREFSLERLMQLTQLDAVGLQWLAGVNLLLVDDSDINLEVAQRILEREGATVRAFDNAPDALDFLRGGATGIDAVLMDVQMPGMDGNAAARIIRDELGLGQLPVIALSAGAFESERARSIAAGMVDFISKPIEPNTLIRGLRRHIERARGAELMLLSGTAATQDDGAAAWPHIEGIDSRDAAQRLGNDIEMFTLMLGRLLREFREPWDAPVPAESDGDGRARLAARMHKLRGSAGMLGAAVVQRLACAAEKAARGKLPWDGLTGSLERLREQLGLIAVQARPLLEAHASRRESAEASAAQPDLPLGLDDLKGLIDLLRAQDFEALHRFELLAGPLRNAMVPADFITLHDAVETFDFARGVCLLVAAFDDLNTAKRAEAATPVPWNGITRRSSLTASG